MLAMELRDRLQPGVRVRVRQQIRKQRQWWTTDVEGEVVSLRREPTGSWFASAPNGRLLLDRLLIRKADGELSELVLDEQSQIDILQ